MKEVVELMQKPLVYLVIILFVTNIFAPAVTASKENLDNSRPKLQELPELDFTDLNPDIDLIEIDQEISNATPDWMLLAHDESGKKRLLNDIDNFSLSTLEKNEMKNTLSDLWESYPTKFEDAGIKSIEIIVESDGVTQNKIIPLGHVTRISFDREKIEQTAQDKNTIEAIRLKKLNPSSPIVLSEAENETIKNITGFRSKKIQHDKESNHQPYTSGSKKPANPDKFLSSETTDKVTF